VAAQGGGGDWVGAMSVTIYMPLLDEGTEVWRPVQAEAQSSNAYLILGPMPEGEAWAFPPGSVVFAKGC
jgi:hypothetical protein